MAVDKTIENHYEPDCSVGDSIGGMEAVRCASLLAAQVMIRKLYHVAAVRLFFCPPEAVDA